MADSNKLFFAQVDDKNDLTEGKRTFIHADNRLLTDQSVLTTSGQVWASILLSLCKKDAELYSFVKNVEFSIMR